MNDHDSQPFVPARIPISSLAQLARDAYYRYGMMLVAQVVGVEAALMVARRSGRFLWKNIPLFRDGVRKVIAEAFGGTHSEKQIADIARAHAEEFRLSFIETEFIHRKLYASTWRNYVRMVGFEPVARRMRAGGGVMAAGTYFGCHQVGMTTLGLWLGGRVAGIVSPLQFSTQRRWMEGLVRRRLANLYPAGDAIHASVRALRAGNLLLMISEHERAGVGAVTAEFLGKKQGFHPTPALLSWRTRCPIAVVSCRRLSKPFKFELRLHDWIEPPKSGRREWVEQTTLRIVRTLDAVVREHPEQFTWLRQHLVVGRNRP